MEPPRTRSPHARASVRAPRSSGKWRDHEAVPIPGGGTEGTGPVVLDTPEGPFNYYRVAGVCIRAGHVLRQQAAADDERALLGRRPEFGEHCRAVLRREMRDVVGESDRVGPPRRFAGNLVTLAIRPCHELAFRDALTLPPGSPLLDVARERVGIEPSTPPMFR